MRLDGSDAVLPLPAPTGLAEGAPVEVGLRPEHLRPVAAGVAEGLAASVLQIEPTGSQTHVLADFGGRRLVAVLEGMVPLAPGEAIALGIDPGNIHIFADDSGAALCRP